MLSFVIAEDKSVDIFSQEAEISCCDDDLNRLHPLCQCHVLRAASEAQSHMTGSSSGSPAVLSVSRIPASSSQLVAS